MQELIHLIPKCELHIHIEGTLEPALMMALAKKNNITLPYNNAAEIEAAYHFTDLQSFLDLYYNGMEVLITEQDFYDLTIAYLTKVATQNVKHVEIFFDPQAHLRRNVPIENIVNGIHRGLQEGQKSFGISYGIIPCFIRDLSETSALETLEKLLPYKNLFVAFGLDSAELGNPPSKFQTVFDKIRSYGLKTVAHAGEEGPAEYIWEAIQLLHVSRIDHGDKCMKDPKLIEYLIQKQLPLTVCPISNLKLRVVQDLAQHPIKRMLELGICATINSDDPAYFGAYVEENYIRCNEALHFTKQEIYQLAKNAIYASFLPEHDKEKLYNELNRTYDQYNPY